MLEEALDEALGGKDDLGIATNLEQMAPYLTDRAQARALEAVARLHPFDQRLAIVGMAPFLASDAAERAVELASALEDASEALAPLATRLSAGRREQVLGQALSAARMVSDDWVRAHRLAALGAYLTEPLLEEAIADALAIEEPARGPLPSPRWSMACPRRHWSGACARRSRRCSRSTTKNGARRSSRSSCRTFRRP